MYVDGYLKHGQCELKHHQEALIPMFLVPASAPQLV